MIWIGDKGRDIYSTWNLSEKDSKKFSVMKEKFENHVKPKSDRVYSRYKFLSRTQKEGETFEKFLTDLRLLVKECGYKDQDDMIRDAIVFGTRNHKVREKCIGEGSDLTLEKAMNFARTCEISKQQIQSMEDKLVHGISKGSTLPNRKSAPTKRKTVNIVVKLVSLNDALHMVKLVESVEIQTTLQLSVTQEKKRAVASSKKNNRSKTMHAVDTSDEEFFIGSVNVNADHKNLKVAPTFSPLKSFSGHCLRCAGTVILPCVWKDAVLPYVKFYIIDQTVNPVLGADICSKLGLVQRIHNIERKNRTVPHGIPQDYRDLFSGLGCLPGTYSIKVDENIQPVIYPPPKIPIALRDKEELDRMELEGVIVKQREPTKWVNSIVTVTKPNGKIRICIDPRDLNRAILREHFPLNTVEEVAARMPGAKIFSKLDATSGFWQTKHDDESSKLERRSYILDTKEL
ncbi:uncharacterized protein LOC134243873 [Saccostrea cucullata]|uniref:uncharacterized protein LOC134243873 n=1 Tax=Saccostrea cuccullata TaxID=36930 RepID=UPI002ED62932